MDTFGLIGCGVIGSRHASLIQEHGQLVAVCDTDREKAEAFAQRYGARAYDSVDALLEAERDLRIVVVCTPNGLHAEHSIKSLQAGKHVLCEQPMCLTSVAGWQMGDQAHFFRRKLFVVNRNRFQPSLQHLQQILAEGALGTLYSFHGQGFRSHPPSYEPESWKGNEELAGGILYTEFAPFMDLVCWLFGEMSEVKGMTGMKAHREYYALEDTVTATVRTKKGVPGTLHFSLNHPAPEGENTLILCTEKGMVRISGPELDRVELTGNTELANQFAPAAALLENKGVDADYYPQVYDQLITALKSGTAGVLQTADAVRAVALMEKIYATTKE